MRTQYFPSQLLLYGFGKYVGPVSRIRKLTTNLNIHDLISCLLRLTNFSPFMIPPKPRQLRQPKNLLKRKEPVIGGMYGYKAERENENWLGRKLTQGFITFTKTFVKRTCRQASQSLKSIYYLSRLRHCKLLMRDTLNFV